MSRTAAVPLLALIWASQVEGSVVVRSRSQKRDRGTRLCGREEGLEEVQDFFQVADEGYIYADVFVDFAGVDFDVDFFAVGGVLGEVAGDAVVEAHAEGEQEVGLLDGVVDPGLAVHAHHAELEGVGGGDGAEAEQGAGDGDLVGFGEGDDFFSAPLSTMPWPARMMGRWEFWMSSTACWMEEDSARSMGWGR